METVRIITKFVSQLADISLHLPLAVPLPGVAKMRTCVVSVERQGARYRQAHICSPETCHRRKPSFFLRRLAQKLAEVV